MHQLQVAEPAQSLRCGERHHGCQRYGVSPVEHLDMADPLETLRRSVEERYHKPKPRRREFKTLQGLERERRRHRHPHQRQDDEHAHRVPQYALVVTAHQELLEQEHQREDDHHGLDGHRQLHLAHDGIVHGKRSAEGNQRQALVAVTEKEPHHQKCSRHKQHEIVLVEHIIQAHHEEQRGDSQRHHHTPVGQQLPQSVKCQVRKVRFYSSSFLAGTKTRRPKMHTNSAPRLPPSTMRERFGRSFLSAGMPRSTT